MTSKSYMRGYRDLYQEVSAAHKLLIRICDGYVKMRIVKIRVREKEQKAADVDGIYAPCRKEIAQKRL